MFQNRKIIKDRTIEQIFSKNNLMHTHKTKNQQNVYTQYLFIYIYKYLLQGLISLWENHTGMSNHLYAVCDTHTFKENI